MENKVRVWLDSTHKGVEICNQSVLKTKTNHVWLDFSLQFRDARL